MHDCHQPNTSTTNVSVTTTSRGIVLIAVESCIYLFLTITAVVGNVLVCLAFYRKKSLRTVTNNFMFSLVLTDLSMAVLVMPLATTSSIVNKWIAGDFGCQIVGYCSYILGGTSLLIVMLLAINRYFRVARPKLYYSMYSQKRSIACSVCAWIVGVGVGFRAAGIRFGKNASRCLPVFPNKSTITYFTLIHIVYVVPPSIVIIVCYVKIYQIIRQHNTTVTRSSREGNAANYGVEEQKVTRLLTVLVVGFYLCWLPVFINSILERCKVVRDIRYRNFYRSFPAFASSVINPIIYATMSRPFRAEFFKILRGN